jgi:hypothetical protein
LPGMTTGWEVSDRVYGIRNRIVPRAAAFFAEWVRRTV